MLSNNHDSDWMTSVRYRRLCDLEPAVSEVGPGFTATSHGCGAPAVDSSTGAIRDARDQVITLFATTLSLDVGHSLHDGSST